MSVHDLAQIILYIGLLIALTPVLGQMMAKVFSGQRTWLSPVLRPLERFIRYMAGYRRSWAAEECHPIWGLLKGNIPLTQSR